MKENRSAFTEAERSRDAAVKWPSTLRVIFGVSMSMQPMLLTQSRGANWQIKHSKEFLVYRLFVQMLATGVLSLITLMKLGAKQCT